MNRMTPPSAAVTSLSTAFSRSSNSPRYLAPAISVAHVERQQPLVAQGFRHVAVDDAQRETLDDGGLADAGLADKHGVILGAAREHLHGAADFLVAADDGIQLAGFRRLGEVARVFLQRIVGVLGAGGVRRAAFADVVDRAVEGLRRHAGLGENFCGVRALFQSERDQQPLDGDEAVAGLVGEFFRVVEQARGGRGEVKLARARALHLRDFRQGRLDLRERLLRAAARLVDEAGAETLLVVEQDFQHMLGRELLMVLPERQLLRGLDKSPRPLRVFFQVHG